MKLNLGSGANRLEGFINIDKYDRFAPDILWDLEQTPYPFAEDDSVDVIVAHHSLEHMGGNPDTFLAIIKEFYRVLKPDGILDVTVPPGHGERFAADPTHVRPIYPQTFALFSKKQCAAWRNLSNTPLADYLDVDFEMVQIDVVLEESWKLKFDSGEISEDELNFALANYNNVYIQTRIIVRKVAMIA